MQRTDTRVHSCVNMYVSDCTTTVPLSDHRGTSGCIYMCMIIVYPHEVFNHGTWPVDHLGDSPRNRGSNQGTPIASDDGPHDLSAW